MKVTTRSRALMVEDHDLLAQSLEKVLHATGIDVDRTSSTPSQGVIDAVRDGNHDLVLLDLDRTNGPDASSDGHHAPPDALPDLIGPLQDTGTPVVVLTGSPEIEQAATEQGAHAVIRTDRDAMSLRETLEALSSPRQR